MVAGTGIFFAFVRPDPLAPARVIVSLDAPGRKRPPAPPAKAQPQKDTPPVADPAPSNKTPSDPPPLVPVNSLEPENTYPLDRWSPMKIPAGYIDAVMIGGTPPARLAIRPLNNDDVLQVTGWAGHRDLGMRMKSVLFSLCGKVVGGAEVAGSRPDVADIVHPNLGRSGWTAWLAVAHLPRCGQATLNAWGVAPFGTLLWPLVGDFSLALPAKPSQPPKAFTTWFRPPTPDRAAQPNLVTVKVRARVVNLRKCGSTACDVVGKIGKGEHKAFLVETVKDWSLIQFEEKSGWLAERLISVA